MNVKELDMLAFILCIASFALFCLLYLKGSPVEVEILEIGEPETIHYIGEKDKYNLSIDISYDNHNYTVNFEQMSQDELDDIIELGSGNSVVLWIYPGYNNEVFSTRKLEFAEYFNKISSQGGTLEQYIRTMPL